MQYYKSMKVAMQNKKYINLSTVIDLRNYANTLSRWFQFRRMFEHVSEQLIQTSFNEYLSVVKPVIHVYWEVIHKCNPLSYGFYTNLNQLQIQIIKTLYNDLKNYDIMDSNQIVDKLQEDQLQNILEKPSVILHRLNLLQSPSNHEFEYWAHTIVVRQVMITSTVVKGKGVGSKDLGMPTANLQVTEQINKKLLEYPNGIYIVTFNILKKQTYMAVMSLGTNPHYQNFIHSRCVEAFILHDFGETKIYGENVSITIHRLIRLEGKFPSFDSFLHAMHNDIYVGKKYSHQYISKTNL